LWFYKVKLSNLHKIGNFNMVRKSGKNQKIINKIRKIFRIFPFFFFHLVSIDMHPPLKIYKINNFFQLNVGLDQTTQSMTKKESPISVSLSTTRIATQHQKCVLVRDMQISSTSSTIRHTRRLRKKSATNWQSKINRK